MKEYNSWNLYPRSQPSQIHRLSWISNIPDFQAIPCAILPYGKGRSYGDCCLNNGGALLDASGLDRFIEFDAKEGILRCEAGVTLQTIRHVILSANWFLPVTPGTEFVTIGGAVANDVHGKNHHRAGSFGCHVERLELLRSDIGRVVCSRVENGDLFAATIGGLGLTGLILWAEMRLKPVQGPYIDCEFVRFETLQEFFDLCATSDKEYEYTVAWLDCSRNGNTMGRGILTRGNHSSAQTHWGASSGRSSGSLIRGFQTPEILISGPTVRAFNWLYFHKQLRAVKKDTVPVERFFYPLDRIEDWNRFYGRRGFLQYQCVIPHENREAAREILELIRESDEVCSLSVLKVFGDTPSPGLMSFPRPGVTLALDFPLQGQGTLDLMERFDSMVKAGGGAVYPAKDARMSAESFQRYFPRWKEFSEFVDPRFSSDFWRRVTGSEKR